MPLFDLFGLGKSAPEPDADKTDKPADGDPPAPSKQKKKFSLPGSRRAWGALLGANALLVVACAGYITVSVLQQRSAAAPKGKAAKARPKKGDKKKPAEGGAPEKTEKKAVAAKVEKKTEKKPPVQTAKKTKGPIGSPSVHAPDLPERSAKPKSGAPKGKIKAPGPAGGGATKKPAKTAAKKKTERITKPVMFAHKDTDAKKVSLVGMFLVSTGGAKPMFKNGDGVWQITLYLKRHVTYRYQFQVIDRDGRKTLTPVKTISVE